MVYKNLVFFFYAFDGFEDNDAVKLHLKCLKYYSGVFDDALFIISVNDVSDESLVKKAEHAIIDCGFKNVRFIVSENDDYREARPFKEEVVDKLDDFDGLVFFGHSKGATNVVNPSMNAKSVLKWIAGMYFFNLDDIQDVERCLISQFKHSFYGTYKVESERIENKNHCWYAGTFYWINPHRLLNNMKQRGESFMKLHDRGYAEIIPGEFDTLGSFGDITLYPFDYNEAGERIAFLAGNDEKYKKYEEYEKNLGI